MIRRYGWSAVCMHGDKSQQERDYVLGEFRNGKTTILVATDVAARGLGETYDVFNGYIGVADPSHGLVLIGQVSFLNCVLSIVAYRWIYQTGFI